MWANTRALYYPGFLDNPSLSLSLSLSSISAIQLNCDFESRWFTPHMIILWLRAASLSVISQFRLFVLWTLRNLVIAKKFSMRIHRQFILNFNAAEGLSLHFILAYIKVKSTNAIIVKIIFFPTWWLIIASFYISLQTDKFRYTA